MIGIRKFHIRLESYLIRGLNTNKSIKDPLQDKSLKRYSKTQQQKILSVINSSNDLKDLIE